MTEIRQELLRLAAELQQQAVALERHSHFTPPIVASFLAADAAGVSSVAERLEILAAAI